jgi:LexA-binding, inner membrane-associated putative hydrolase
MANFSTHIGVGTVVAGALATVTLATELVAPKDIVAVTLAGVLGSVLPDVDLRDSRPGRAMFAGLAVFFSFAVLFSVESRYSIAEMLILWLGTLVFVRYVVGSIFHHFNYHRGIWHSLLAAAFSGFVTAGAFYRILGRDPSVAWLAAAFMIAGFLTHLILDEIYSVDVMDTRIKASFGTALKFIDPKHMGQTGVMAAATVVAFLLTPSVRPFFDSIVTRPVWTALQQRMLPHDHWFGIDWRGTASLLETPDSEGKTSTGANTISTGSIVPGPDDKPKQ